MRRGTTDRAVLWNRLEVWMLLTWKASGRSGVANSREQGLSIKSARNVKRTQISSGYKCLRKDALRLNFWSWTTTTEPNRPGGDLACSRRPRSRTNVRGGPGLGWAGEDS